MLSELRGKIAVGGSGVTRTYARNYETHIEELMKFICCETWSHSVIRIQTKQTFAH